MPCSPCSSHCCLTALVHRLLLLPLHQVAYPAYFAACCQQCLAAGCLQLHLLAMLVHYLLTALMLRNHHRLQMPLQLG